MIDSSPNMVSILEMLLNLKIKIKLRIFYGQTLLKKLRSSRLEVFCRKSVLRNVAQFTGKHLRQSLFFNKVADLRQKKKKKAKTTTQEMEFSIKDLFSKCDQICRKLRL